MLKDLFKDGESRMDSGISVLSEDLMGIRTGRASPALIEKLPIEYYGVSVPLIQMATISVPEARQLLIRPFDSATLKTIERAILASDLGLTPNNDGKVIRLNLPALTEERRRDLMKLVNNRIEDCRVAMRNIRRDILKDLREFEKEKLISEDELASAEKELQELVDQKIREVDEVGKLKEKEIMEV